MVTSSRARVGPRVLAATAVVLLGGGLLAGCDSDPRAAATAGEATLTVDRLDAATAAYCDYVADVGVEAVPRAIVRSGLTELWLYDTALTEAAGPDALDPPPAADDIAREMQAVGADADVASFTVRLLTVSNALSDPTVGQLASSTLADLDVTVNPAVGSYADGAVSTGGDGVSVAASDTALGATFTLDDPPTPEEVAALPAAQRCGGSAE
ncbi:hypothetical protein [Nocardioides zeae]|uniref:Lipoprotein n=1 Tax=Nocardioides zeae TaxID=1457234 RepID=A0A6P0HJN3_9ACTN|nr:hypothetical protein [Nocardioides zeae]NEN78922.1 hypothetical protein [Nocardioides zeae]